MERMNLFSDAGAKSSEDIEKQKTDNISKIDKINNEIRKRSLSDMTSLF